MYFPSENIVAKGSDSDRDRVLQRMLVRPWKFLFLLCVTLEQLKTSGTCITNA